jgi:type II restriction enzyme
MTNRGEAIARLAGTLSDGQLALLESIVETFMQPISGYRDSLSDVVSQEFLSAFGDILKLHHSLSDDYLDKYRFESAMHRVYRALGRDAVRPGRCFPGHDLTVDGVKWSLKTQGDRQIKQDLLHISKYMELGKGKWKTKNDLVGLRDRFLQHLNGYERILQLRYFQLSPIDSESMQHFYELVEIPKPLLLESGNGVFEMRHTSKQTPKPGYCTITDSDGEIRFQLYFDGGTERKLQIKHLRKELCIVHATWQF